MNKLLAALIAGLFAAGAFAQPAPDAPAIQPAQPTQPAFTPPHAGAPERVAPAPHKAAKKKKPVKKSKKSRKGHAKAHGKAHAA